MTMQQVPNQTRNSPTFFQNLISPTGVTGLSKRDEQKFIASLTDKFKQAKSDRWKAERQWYLNLAFYFGRQNVIVQDAPGAARSFKLFTPPAPYYRSRPIINLIRPLMRTEMSKMTSQKPSAFVVPSSSDERDMYAATAGEQIWDSQYRDKNFARILRRAVFWASMTGNGFVKSYWDQSKVDKVTNLMGDICFENVTPFHMFVPDLKEPELEDQPYVIHAEMRDTQTLRKIYNLQIQASNENEITEPTLGDVMDVNQDKAKKDEKTMVLEFHFKPGGLDQLPEGGVVTVADNKILHFFEGMYGHGQYPFAHIRHIETGKFYGDSTINDLIPLQREYNRTRGQIIEAKNRMAKPQLSAEIGSVDPNKITSEPGQIVMYRPGFNPPSPIPLQPLPQYVLEEQDRIKDDMNDISGQHEVSKGQTPAGVTAATAISYLQEQDDSKLSYSYTSIEECVEKVAHQTLCYVQEFWTTPRKVKIAGDDGAFDVMAFEGADIAGNTDIRVEAGSSLPTSRAAKQAFIMDLMKMGFIDPQKGLEVMEIGGINKIYDSLQVDIRQAQRENLRMAAVTADIIQQDRQAKLQEMMADPDFQDALAQGVLQLDQQTGQVFMNSEEGPQEMQFPLLVQVNSWDNHRLHIERHNQYRKSQAFEKLPPEAKQLFEDHVNGHIEAIMVGAQGAMNMPQGMLDMANNPETYQEMENGTSQDSGVAGGSVTPPEMQSDLAAQDSGQQQGAQ
jgi:hypothetical protein